MPFSGGITVATDVEDNGANYSLIKVLEHIARGCSRCNKSVLLQPLHSVVLCRAASSRFLQYHLNNDVSKLRPAGKLINMEIVETERLPDILVLLFVMLYVRARAYLVYLADGHSKEFECFAAS